jgi:D-amino-acid dehydrogenase
MQPRKTVVIGAGTVGVCAALYLQRDGHAVGLIDRNEPGTGCSYGNAGVVQVTACVPIATPGVLRDVPRMLLSKDQPLVIRWQYLPWLAPYLLRFINAARPSEVERISQALTRILVLAKDSYAPLIAAAGAADLIKPTGELHVYETEAAYRKARFGHDLRRARGLRIEDIGPVQISEIEPSLAPIFRHAIYLPDPVQTVSPYLFTRKLAESFVRAGGELVQENVEDILLGPNGVIHVVTGQARRPATDLVLAAGAHSKRWAAKLGSYVPLDSERGYHLTLPDPGVELRVPVISGDYRFGIASMTEGLRLAGTAELARLDAKPNYTRAQRLIRWRSACCQSSIRKVPSRGWGSVHPRRTACLSLVDHRMCRTSISPSVMAISASRSRPRPAASSPIWWHRGLSRSTSRISAFRASANSASASHKLLVMLSARADEVIE